jgi:hypothetical protein
MTTASKRVVLIRSSHPYRTALAQPWNSFVVIRTFNRKWDVVSDIDTSTRHGTQPGAKPVRTRPAQHDDLANCVTAGTKNETKTSDDVPSKLQLQHKCALTYAKFIQLDHYIYKAHFVNTVPSTV